MTSHNLYPRGSDPGGCSSSLLRMLQALQSLIPPFAIELYIGALAQVAENYKSCSGPRQSRTLQTSSYILSYTYTSTRPHTGISPPTSTFKHRRYVHFVASLRTSKTSLLYPEMTPRGKLIPHIAFFYLLDMTERKGSMLALLGAGLKMKGGFSVILITET